MNPLDQLADIHLPADPSWWPPAPGWWLAGGLLLVALLLSCWYMGKRYRRNGFRREAIRQARELASENRLDPAAAVTLIRQTALASEPGSALVTVPGPQVLLRLSTFAGDTLANELAPGGIEPLSALLYGNREHRLNASQQASLLRALETWIRRHRREDLC